MATNRFEGKSLLECYTAGREIFKTLDSASVGGNDPKYRILVEDGIASLRACLYLIDRTGLFSTNEEVEDIKTTSLKYAYAHYEILACFLRV